MNKKLVSMGIVGALTLSTLLAACGSSGGSAAKSEPESAASSAAVSSAVEETASSAAEEAVSEAASSAAEEAASSAEEEAVSEAASSAEEEAVSEAASSAEETEAEAASSDAEEAASSETASSDAEEAASSAAEEKEEDAAPSVVANGEDVTISILHFKTEVADQIEDAIAAYEEEHPNVTITTQVSNDYNSDLKARMSSSDKPTIYNLDGAEDLKEWEGYYEDLSDQPWVGEVFEGYLDNMTLDGKVYGLPMSVEGYGFIYNKAIFDAAGIDLASCVTVDDFDKAFGELKEKIDNGDLAEDYPDLAAVLSFPAGEGWVPGLHTSNVFLSAEFEGSAAAAAEAEGIEFKYGDDFQKLVDLQVKYTADAEEPSLLNAVDYSSQMSDLLTETVAVIQQGNWISSEVMNTDEELLGKLDMVAMPSTEATAGTLPVGVNTNWVVNAQADANQIEAAKDFLNWLYTSETGKDFVINQFGFIPVMSGYEDFEIENPLINAIIRYSGDGKTTNWVIAAYPAGWSDGVCGSDIQAYLAGEKTWDEVISDCVEQWKALKTQ